MSLHDLRRYRALLLLWFIGGFRGSSGHSLERWGLRLLHVVGVAFTMLLGGLLEPALSRVLPGMDPLSLVHRLLLAWILLWPFLLSLWQRRPALPVRPWLLLPVSHTWLAHVLQVLSPLHGGNALLAGFMLGYWLRSLVLSHAWLPAMGWLLMALSLLTAAQWTANLLRALRFTRPEAYVLIWLSGLVGLGLAGMYGGLTWLARHTFDAILTGRFTGLTGLIALNGLFYVPAFLLTRRYLYVDHLFMSRAPTTSTVHSRWSRTPTRFMVWLQWRLLWRHRVTRLLLYLTVLFGFMGSVQLINASRQDALLPLFLGVPFLILGSAQFLLSVFGWQYTHADGLFTWPLPGRALAGSLLWLAFVLASLTFLSAVGTWVLLARLDAEVLTWLGVSYVYLTGFVHPVLIWQAPVHTVRIELHPHALTSGAGNTYRRPLRLISLVLILIGPAALGLWVGGYGLLLLALVGIAGLLLYPHWLRLCETHLTHHKYHLLAHLRTA